MAIFLFGVSACLCWILILLHMGSLNVFGKVTFRWWDKVTFVTGVCMYIRNMSFEVLLSINGLVTKVTGKSLFIYSMIGFHMFLQDFFSGYFIVTLFTAIWIYKWITKFWNLLFIIMISLDVFFQLIDRKKRPSPKNSPETLRNSKFHIRNTFNPILGHLGEWRF